MHISRRTYGSYDVFLKGNVLFVFQSFEIKIGYSCVLERQLKSAILVAVKEPIQIGTSVQVGNQILLRCTPCHKPSP